MRKDDLEEGFNTLEEIVKKLENGELSLNDSFSLYQEGIEIVKKCNESLDMMEKQIKVIEKEDCEVVADDGENL